MPVAGFARQLPAPRGGQAVVLGAAIVLRQAPLRRDEAFLLELQEGGVEGAVIEGQAVLAGLLDAAIDAVAVEGPEDLEGFEDHQGQSALFDVQLLCHTPVLWDTHSTVTPQSGFRQAPGRADGCCSAATSSSDRPLRRRTETQRPAPAAALRRSQRG